MIPNKTDFHDKMNLFYGLTTAVRVSIFSVYCTTLMLCAPKLTDNKRDPLAEFFTDVYRFSSRGKFSSTNLFALEDKVSVRVRS